MRRVTGRLAHGLCRCVTTMRCSSPRRNTAWGRFSGNTPPDCGPAANMPSSTDGAASKFASLFTGISRTCRSSRSRRRSGAAGKRSYINNLSHVCNDGIRPDWPGTFAIGDSVPGGPGRGSVAPGVTACPASAGFDSRRNIGDDARGGITARCRLLRQQTASALRRRSG